MYPNLRTPPTLLALAALLTLPSPASAQAPARTEPEERDPVARPGATVVSGDARFTLLTDRLVRMEWAADGRFEDRASVVFVNRRLPVPEHERRTEDGWLVLDTGPLELRYREGTGRFDADNLEVRVEVAGERVAWRPGAPDTANLGGTIRTLDGVSEPVSMGKGLLSRAGWALVDDSERPLLDDGDRPWAVPRPEGERIDWYLFGHGHRYREALADFTEVAGRIPMPPKFAFGRWWSRYWAYTDAELMELVEGFDRAGVPLDVLVVDMDWHETFELRWRRERRDQAGQPLGWTGYTWNPTYFPDPEAFLGWAERKGLETPLNIHPASGIQPHEERYEEMARAVGIDPATEEYVPFRITDRGFARAYFEHVIHPLEEEGVDFWWLDWQQWHETEIPGLTPTWWLNHVFYSDMRRRGRRRPIILHRYGGLGNHRYQIGFSGDARSTWEMLDFEREFTATASNVGFGYWSHDIGGHAPGEVSGELYTRWVQFGVFSPIVRTHTTKNPDAERRSWAYPPVHARAMREAHRLRYRLIPYIYTAAREAYDTGVSPVRPLYYDHPEAEEAYAFRDEYMFGRDLLVKPVARPLSEDSLVARVELWLPPGEWVEWPTGARLEGDRVVRRSFALDEIPVYARAGAVLPTRPARLRIGASPVDTLVVEAFPGDSGSAEMYGDAGDSEGYRRGELARTPIRRLRREGGATVVTVGPSEGEYPGMPRRRALRIRLRGTWPPERVTVDGEAAPYRPRGGAPGWRYDGDRLATVVSVPERPVRSRVEVVVVPGGPGGPEGAEGSEAPGGSARGAGRDALLEGVPGAISRLRRAVDVLEALWPEDWPPESLIDLAQTGRRITLRPDSALPNLVRLREGLPAATREVRGLRGAEGPVRRALAHLATVRELLEPAPEAGTPGAGGRAGAGERGGAGRGAGAGNDAGAGGDAGSVEGAGPAGSPEDRGRLKSESESDSHFRPGPDEPHRGTYHQREEYR